MVTDNPDRVKTQDFLNAVNNDKEDDPFLAKAPGNGVFHGRATGSWDST